MRIAVVILNWNTEGFLKRFLPGLLSSVEMVEGAEVVVADNASTDGSMQVMREMFPQVRTIVFDRNLGFTGGYNEAFRRIVTEAPKDEAPDYFVLINSDIEVGGKWLSPLVEWMDSHPLCGACAPKLHSYQRREMFEYAGAAGGYIDRFGYPFCRGRVLSKVEEDFGQYDSPEEVFWATGACLMVRSSVYASLGGLDDRFFAHMEEIDLCWRMRLRGYSVNVVPSSVVWHLGGGTLPSSSPMKLFLNYRNNLLMLSNNLPTHFAVEEFRGGAVASEAARKGVRRARKRIFGRMVLDGMSAAVYLLTFKMESFKAVVRAHKEYRRLVTEPDPAKVEAFLQDFGDKARTDRIYPKWIVLQFYLRRSRIFPTLRHWETTLPSPQSQNRNAPKRCETSASNATA
ncbi:MAG: glycosyltransferase family 2 protein [Candidatus Cryptobacteroides sp.]